MTDEKDKEGGEVIHLTGVDMVGRALDKPKGPEPAPPGGTAKPRGPAGGLPADSPVIPLGVNGDKFWFLNANGQVVGYEGTKLGRNTISGLFGKFNKSFLRQHYPRVRADKGNVIGFHGEAVADDLIQRCSERGVWDPFTRLRGAGGWLGDDGELIFHCGDVILIGGKEHPPGEIGKYIYPTEAKQPRPAPDPQGIEAGEELLERLRAWNWRRPDVAPLLKLGFIGDGMLGGALKWRPLAWLTGGQATGKSTFHEFYGKILGGGLVKVADATPAGIWQKVKHSTLPVAIDEMEPEADGRKSQSLVRLARQAASGGMMMRGGANHEPVEFQTRSTYLFSSILIPPLQPQDRSRMMVIELEPLARGAKVPRLDDDELGRLGARIRRRLVDVWPRFPKRLEAWRQALIAVEHTARGADVYGTTLAVADLLLHDGEEFDREWASEIIDQLRPDDLEGWGDAAPDEIQMLRHLTSTAVDPYRSGTRQTMGEWIFKAAGGEPDSNAGECNRMIGTWGLRVIHDRAGKRWLAMAYRHQELERIFKDTHWAGRPGASSPRNQAARRLEGARRSRGTLRFAQHTSKATLIPLELVLPAPDDDTETERTVPALEDVKI